MGRDRLKGLSLAVLVTVLGIALYRAWPASVGTSTGGSMAGSAARSATAEAPAEPPDVSLEALAAERPRPRAANRNLFRFEQRSLPDRPTLTRPPADVPPSEPPPPSVAPIPLKFIGIVEAPERSLIIAVLSDGRGVYYGREGGIVEGRYRIWRIGTESIEISHLDGSGRLMIRLTGS